MSSSPNLTPEQQAAAEAAEEAFHDFAIESWTLFSIGLCVTILRTYARIKAVRLSGLSPDDYFVWVGVLFYSAQAALAYSVGNLAHGLANNGLTDAERAALDPSSEEYHQRVLGSQIQVAGWTVYSCLIWALKVSMLFFYVRLMKGLGRPYQMRIYIGFALLFCSFIAVIGSIFGACRPFHNYWQINPNPGRVCQPAISLAIVWSSFAANISTDIYLIMIPLPILWRSGLRISQKIASSFVLGAGIFVLVCATLKSAFVLVDPVNGAQLAGSWGTRESFVAVMVTNLPMIFPLFKRWLRPLFGSKLGSSNQVDKSPTNFRTIGGGGPGADRSRARRKPRSAHALSNLTFGDDSNELICNSNNPHSVDVSVDTTAQQEDRGYYETPTTSNAATLRHDDGSHASGQNSATSTKLREW